ncbi:helix-turn-helix domain-containing protein [Actinomyces bowdenii]|nr:helix-turn-helix transcriptional regulator [Actinomyces bowdenii]
MPMVQHAVREARSASRPARQPDEVQHSLWLRFGRRKVERMVADNLEHGLTQEAVAKKYGVAPSTVNKYIQEFKRRAPVDSFPGHE